MKGLIVGLLAAVLATGAQGETLRLDGIVALVDEDVILTSELEERLEQVRQSFVARGAGIDDEQALLSQVLERLIVEKLQLQMAHRGGVRISDEELNRTLARVAAQNDMDIAGFREALEQDGISYARTREQLRREIMISQVQQGVLRGRIQISEQEIASFLESEQGRLLTADEYRLLHILLPWSGDEPDRAEVVRQRRKARQIMADISTPEDFQRMALAHSTGRQVLEGGDLGWRKLAQLPTLFAALVPDLKVGELAGPVRSGSGFHIIMLQEQRGVSVEGQVPQRRARHILVQPSEIRSREEARDLAESVRDLLLAGRDFAELAKLYSDDPGSALVGGDLGWNRAGVFVPEFERLLDRLEIDELGEVLETVHGFHLVQVTGRRIEDFSDDYRRSMAVGFLRDRKFEEELETWLREIREEAFVEIRI